MNFGGTLTQKSNSDRAIHLEIEINASISDIWNAWTTKEGIQSFFSPDCFVEFKVGGCYENYFNPDAKVGERGGEGNKILAIQNETMFSFSWNAPPHLPDVRNQRTHVCIRFTKIEKNKTKISLYHDGWGTGGQWDEAFEYFQIAWGKIVLPRLIYRFESGPIDWNNLPKLD